MLRPSSFAPWWAGGASLVGVAGALAALAAALAITVATFGFAFPGVHDIIPRRFGADVVIHVGEAILTFTRHGVLADFIALTPSSATLNASFVTLGAAPGLPNAVPLAVEPGELVLAGATLGLPDVPAFPLAVNVVPGYPKSPAVDNNGRWVNASVGVPVETITGTPNQIAASCAGYDCVLALEQDIATNSTPTFAAVVVGGATLVGSGAATATFPAITGNVILDAGAQTVGGQKSFTATVVHRSDTGVQLNNAANTFATTVRAAAGLAANIDIRTPGTNGAAGNVVVTDGAGNWAYGVNGAALARYYTTTPVLVTGAGFSSLFGTGAGSLTIPANTLLPGIRVNYELYCTYVNGAGATTIRITLGGTTIVTGAAFSGASGPLLIKGDVFVPSAGQIVGGGKVFRSTTTAAVLIQPSPVAFVPASPLAFDVQSSQGAATLTCRGDMWVTPGA